MAEQRDNDDFGTYRKLLLHELERLNSRVEQVDEKGQKERQRLTDEISKMRIALESKVNSVQADVVMLKTNSKIWGGAIGAVAAAVVSAIAAMLFGSKH